MHVTKFTWQKNNKRDQKFGNLLLSFMKHYGEEVDYAKIGINTLTDDQFHKGSGGDLFL